MLTIVIKALLARDDLSSGDLKLNQPLTVSSSILITRAKSRVTSWPMNAQNIDQMLYISHVTRQHIIYAIEVESDMRYY